LGKNAIISGIGFTDIHSIRFAQGVTAFPAGVQAASTWDVGLINQRGAAMGAEAKGLGVNLQLGPVAGPLGKNAAVRLISEILFV